MIKYHTHEVIFFTRSGRTPPCQTGLVLSIRSILMLHQYLMSEGVKYLCTSKLNQDCLEVIKTKTWVLLCSTPCLCNLTMVHFCLFQNLFSVIWGKGGHQFNPSAREFSAALRSASVANIMTLQTVLLVTFTKFTPGRGGVKGGGGLGRKGRGKRWGVKKVFEALDDPLWWVSWREWKSLFNCFSLFSTKIIVI